MKKTLMTLVLCTLSALAVGCGLLEPSPEEQAQNSLEMAEKLKAGTIETALEYNNGLVGLETELMGHLSSLDQVEPGSDEQAEILATATENCRESLELLKSHTPYAGGGDMKKAAVQLFEAYLAMLEWLAAPLEGDLTQADVDAQEKVLMSAIETATSKYRAAQKQFALAEDFVLLDSVEVSSE